MLSTSPTIRQAALAAAIATLMSGCSSDGGAINDIDGDNVLSTVEQGNSPALDDAAITDTAPANDSETETSAALISRTNFDDQLKQVVDVLNLSDLNELRSEFERLSYSMGANGQAVLEGGELPAFLSVASSSTIEDDGAGISEHNILYNCANGGMIDQHLRATLAPISISAIRYDNCEWVDESDENTALMLNGAGRFETGRRSDQITNLENFTRAVDSNVQTASGVHTQTYLWVGDGDVERWENTSFEVSELEQTISVTDLNISRAGIIQTELPREYRYVYDLEGQVQRIQPVNHNAVLTASFTLNSDATGNSPVTVEADLGLDTPYWLWAPEFTTSVAPDYPVSDLGSSLNYAFSPDLETATFFTEELHPIPERSQWVTGEVVMTAVDGSRLSLTHNVDNKDEIRVNFGDTSAQEIRSVNDGYQITCASVMPGCGDLAE